MANRVAAADADAERQHARLVGRDARLALSLVRVGGRGVTLLQLGPWQTLLAAS